MISSFQIGLKLDTAMEARIISLMKYKMEPPGNTLAVLIETRIDVQRIVLRYTNDYWLNIDF